MKHTNTNSEPAPTSAPAQQPWRSAAPTREAQAERAEQAGGFPSLREGEGAWERTLARLEHTKRKLHLDTALCWRRVANMCCSQDVKFFALARMRDAALAWRGKL